MIFGVFIHAPEIIAALACDDIFGAEHGGHHRVILIIVFVHPISPDEVECGKACVQFGTHCGDMFCVVVVVNRVGFSLSDDAAVFYVANLSKAEIENFLGAEGDEFFVAHVPKPVALEAEILQPVASLCGIGHHLGRP